MEDISKYSFIYCLYINGISCPWKCISLFEFILKKLIKRSNVDNLLILIFGGIYLSSLDVLGN